MTGKVYIVSAGSGNSELLSTRALTLLRTADAVLHDSSVADAVLAFARPGARVHEVGAYRQGKNTLAEREVRARMVAFASEGLTVMRLKGGSHFDDEAEALRACGVEFEVLPAVSAATVP